MVLNDPINGRQAESQAGSHPLGGKPRVEDPVEILGWDAPARVRKLEHSRLAFLIGCDRDGSFPIDGLNRIHEEVHEGLIQLTGRALYLRYRAVIPAHVDSPSKLVMKKGEGAVDAYVKVGPLDAGFIKTSEVAQ